VARHERERIAYPCSQCGGRMETKDSRPAYYLGLPAVRRRRRCIKCAWAATTYEVAERSLVKSGTRLERTMPVLRRMQETLDALISEFDAEEPGGDAGDAHDDEPREETHSGSRPREVS
jgi:hypothetical protein